MIRIDKINSANFICIYFFFIGLILILSDVFGLEFNPEISDIVFKERGTYYIMISLFIYQIFLTSEELYIRLADTLSLVLFLFIIFEPLYDMMSHPYMIWFDVSIEVFFIMLLQFEKYYYK